MTHTATDDRADLGFATLTEHVGSRISGLDLSRPVSEEAYRRIRRELADRSVLFIPGQHGLSPDRQIAFSRRFGELEHHVLQNFCLPGHPEIFVVSNIVENGRNIGAYRGSKHYHSDLSYMKEPSMGSLFYCLECPEQGGETCFASMFAAFDALPAHRRNWLKSRNAIHDYVWNHERRHQHRSPLSKEQKSRTPPVVHPAVIRHPENGRSALYISETFTRRFEGMNDADSGEIVEELTDFVSQPRFEYRHRWSPGDLIIWDNRSVVHKQLPFDDQNTRRRMHRTTIRGGMLSSANL